MRAQPRLLVRGIGCLGDLSNSYCLGRGGLFFFETLNLGEKMNSLKRYREKILISKAELASKAGISVMTIDRIEKGKSCRLETKRKIILALDLKLSERHKVFGD